MRSYSYTENFRKFKGKQYDKDGSLMWSIYTDCADTIGREVYIVTCEEILCYKSYASKKAMQQQSQQPKHQDSDGAKLAKTGLEFAADIIIDGVMQGQGMAKRVQPGSTGPFAGADKSLNHMDRFFNYNGKKVKAIEVRRDRCEIIIRKFMGQATISTTVDDFDEILSRICSICPNATISGS